MIIGEAMKGDVLVQYSKAGFDPTIMRRHADCPGIDPLHRTDAPLKHQSGMTRENKINTACSFLNPLDFF
tara:strand:+ start:1166 stop:1375 length:210 start_codon:yes stop_codon:yes gene_type:complete